MKTSAIISGMQRGPRGWASLESLMSLANIRDEKSTAVSFYFKWSSFPDTAHREEMLSIEGLLDGFKREHRLDAEDPDLSKDLARILKAEEQIRQAPAPLRAIFACNSKNIWHEVDVPADESAGSLDVARYFRLVPLLRAVESCTPYCVALVEHGKARAFLVRGEEINEDDRGFPALDISLHAEDSRVGWSHHIDGKVDERKRAYFKQLAGELRLFLQQNNCSDLVIGCRPDLWSELAPQLKEAGMDSALAGHFHLASFDIIGGDVLRAAKRIFEEKQRERYTKFWDHVREEPAHSAIGVQAVLQDLSAGRVQQLFLGDLRGVEAFECANCSEPRLRTGDRCTVCGHSEVAPIPAEELLFRRALATGAEILAPQVRKEDSFGSVGAILRY